MEYIVEISVNMLKQTAFTDIENKIKEIANLYHCNSIYIINEEDGTIKIPRHHSIFVVHFYGYHIENIIRFVRFIKSVKTIYIECIYNNHFKLIYASSYYLKTVERDTLEKYVRHIGEIPIGSREDKILQECKK